mgnify:CR=1 FL=1|nr:hypothetical protein [uncultured Romboutsia sp.]
MSLKYKELENQIINEKNKKLYYKLLNQICEKDIENMDMCKKIIDKSFKKRLSQNDELKLKSKIKQVFGRNSANLDGDDSLDKWLEYIDINYTIEDKKIIIGE